MAGKSIGNLFFTIEASIAKFTASMDRVKKTVATTEKQQVTMNKTVQKENKATSLSFAVMAGAAAAFAFELLKSSALAQFAMGALSDLAELGVVALAGVPAAIQENIAAWQAYWTFLTTKDPEKKKEAEKKLKEPPRSGTIDVGGPAAWWEGIKKGFGGAGEWLKKQFEPHGYTTGFALGGLIKSGIMDRIKEVPGKVLDVIKNGLTDLGRVIRERITEGFDWILDGLTWVQDHILTPISDGLANLPGKITEAIVAGFDWILDGLTWVQDHIITPIGDGLATLPGKITEAIVAGFDWILDGGKWTKEHIVDPIINGLTGISGKIAAKLGEEVGAVGGAVSGAAKGLWDMLPELQEGGYVSSTGPAFLHAGEYVLPPGVVNNINRGGNSASVVINISAPGGLTAGAGVALGSDLRSHLTDYLRGIVGA